jgi:hypothetical protein
MATSPRRAPPRSAALDGEIHPHKRRWPATSQTSTAKPRNRRISITTIIILILAAFAGITYYFGTPALQPSATPTLGSCPQSAQIVVGNSSGANASTKNYQPPDLSLVLGVNSTVSWIDEDPGFELHVISVAVPQNGPEWDLNITDAAGANTQCVALTAPGTYTYEMFVPYVVAGTIVVKGPATTSAG